VPVFRHPDAIADDQAPTELDAEAARADRDIAAFIASADPLPGPPVAELSAAVIDILRAAWEEVEALMADVAYNQLLATMLEVSRRARMTGSDDPSQWQASAASSILSGLVGVRRPG
jgi:hypothetical protein